MNLPPFFKVYFNNLIGVIKFLKIEIENLQSKLSSLLSKYEAVKSRESTLLEENEALKARNSELERIMKSNSTNSHKPPSTDMYKPKSKAVFSSPKIKKRHGGQVGHKGKTLQAVANPDFEFDMRPSTCTCGMTLEGVKGEIVEIRQVFDVPEPRLEVTQYNKMSCTCPNCGTQNSGAFPDGVDAYVQYGNGVRAYAVVLNTSYNVPFRKVSQLFDDQYGYDINVSTLISANEICYVNLEQTEISIKHAVTQTRVVHFDETGISVAGKRIWLHDASTPELTYQFVSEHRGNLAIGSEAGVIAQFKGWAIHDCYGTYFTFENCKHGLCNAHILRELEAQIEGGRKWAKRMQDLLWELYEKSNKGRSIVVEFAPYSLLYDDICKQADTEEPQPLPRAKEQRGKIKQTKGRNLLDRLVKHKLAVLAFAQHPEVPYTNNQAERDIRPAKTKLKVSGGYRAKSGAEQYARIQGFISTCRKQGQNVYDMIKKSFTPGFKYEFSSG